MHTTILGNHSLTNHLVFTVHTCVYILTILVIYKKKKIQFGLDKSIYRLCGNFKNHN